MEVQIIDTEHMAAQQTTIHYAGTSDDGGPSLTARAANCSILPLTIARLSGRQNRKHREKGQFDGLEPRFHRRFAFLIPTKHHKYRAGSVPAPIFSIT